MVYGLVESKKKDPKERVKEDERKVKELWEQMEVEVEEGETEVKFRAGKQKEDGKPRPLILTVKDAEKRERLLDSGRKLARKEGWKKVFVAPDLTSRQRREEKKKKNERKKKDQGSGGWILVGREVEEGWYEDRRIWKWEQT